MESHRNVLGLILFKIYVNDLSEEVKDCVLIHYADDTQYLQIGTTDSLPQLIQNTEQTLTKLKHCFNKNGLHLNSMTTQCILINKNGNTTVSAEAASIHPRSVFFYFFLFISEDAAQGHKKKEEKKSPLLAAP